MVVLGGGGGEGDGAAGDDAALRRGGGAPLAVVAHHADGGIVRVGSEGGGVGHVGGEGQLARIVAVAVVPVQEVVTLVGGGVDGDVAVPIVDTSAADAAHGGIVGGQGEADGVDGKGGGEQRVAHDGQGAYGIGVAVAPLHEVVVGSRSGGDGDDLIVGVGVAGGSHCYCTLGLIGRLGVDV